MFRRTLLYLLVIGFSVACTGESTATHTLSEVKAALDSAGYAVGECNEQAASLIGAVEGCSYSVGPDNIEVFRFDMSIQSGREALRTVEEEGVGGQRALVVGNVAVIVFDHPDSTAIRQVLENL